MDGVHRDLQEPGFGSSNHTQLFKKLGAENSPVPGGEVSGSDNELHERVWYFLTTWAMCCCCVVFLSFFSGGARHDQKNPTLLEGVVKVGECWWLTIFFEIFESNKPLSRILRGLNHHNYITITASSWLNIFGLPV